MSDSAAVVEAAQKQSFHDRIVNVDGPVMHVDRTGQAVSTRWFSFLCIERNALMIDNL